MARPSLAVFKRHFKEYVEEKKTDLINPDPISDHIQQSRCSG